MIQTLLPLLAAGLSTPMTMHTVVDQTATHGVAYRYLAPTGWKAEAAVTWQAEVSSPTALTAFAASPDERFGYLLAQGQDFHYFVKNGGMWVNVMTPGMKQGLTPPDRLSDFLLDYAKRLLKLEIRVTKRQDGRLSGAAIPKYRNFGAVGGLEFEFTDSNGRPNVGLIFAGMDGYQVGDTVHAGMSYQGDWRIENLFMVTAPKGEEQKALRFFSFGAPTYTPTRAFIVARGAYQMVLNHQINVQIANAGEVSKAIGKLSGQMEDAIMGRFRAGQKADDKAQSAFCDYIGDVRRSKNLDGTEIQTNSNAGDVWEDGHGNVSMGGDPNAGSGGGWTKLKKIGE